MVLFCFAHNDGFGEECQDQKAKHEAGRGARKWIEAGKKVVETGGIDPPTSHMLSERSTIWATSPYIHVSRSWPDLIQILISE